MKFKIDSNSELYKTLEDYLTVRHEGGSRTTPTYSDVNDVYEVVLEELSTNIKIDLFKEICIPSIDPEQMKNLEEIIEQLYNVRQDLHWSDCATHNEPAERNAKCDCKKLNL